MNLITPFSRFFYTLTIGNVILENLQRFLFFSQIETRVYCTSIYFNIFAFFYYGILDKLQIYFKYALFYNIKFCFSYNLFVPFFYLLFILTI